jgi:hypothetical protein
MHGFSSSKSFDDVELRFGQFPTYNIPHSLDKLGSAGSCSVEDELGDAATPGDRIQVVEIP